MSKDLIGRSVGTTSTPMSGALARQFAREADGINVRGQLAHQTDAVQAIVTRASVRNLQSIVQDVRRALEEDPIGAEYYGEIVAAYAQSAAERIRRFS